MSHCRACYQTVTDPESSACDSEQCAVINPDNPSDRCLRTWGLCVRRNFPGVSCLGGGGIQNENIQLSNWGGVYIFNFQLSAAMIPPELIDFNVVVLSSE